MYNDNFSSQLKNAILNYKLNRENKSDKKKSLNNLSAVINNLKNQKIYLDFLYKTFDFIYENKDIIIDIADILLEYNNENELGAIMRLYHNENELGAIMRLYHNENELGAIMRLYHNKFLLNDNKFSVSFNSFASFIVSLRRDQSTFFKYMKECCDLYIKNDNEKADEDLKEYKKILCDSLNRYLKGRFYNIVNIKEKGKFDATEFLENNIDLFLSDVDKFKCKFLKFVYNQKVIDNELNNKDYDKNRFFPLSCFFKKPLSKEEKFNEFKNKEIYRLDKLSGDDRLKIINISISHIESVLAKKRNITNFKKICLRILKEAYMKKNKGFHATMLKARQKQNFVSSGLYIMTCE